MPVKASVASITFSDGTLIELHGGDRVVLVGPNNAGKSEALRNIFNGCAGISLGPVVTDFETEKSAESDNDISAFLKENFVQFSTDHFLTPVGTMTVDNFKKQFTPEGVFSGLMPLFVSLLNVTNRIQISEAAPSIDFYTQPKTHPLHRLHQDLELRRKLATWFRRAFGTGIAIDFMAGLTIPLHVGDEVELRAGETPMDQQYIGRLRLYPRLESQGDGMRSFVGLLLHVALTFHRIILIDEPEAFLHPPQARLLGTLLGREVPPEQQLFLATHSADVLRGLLESESRGLRIIRLRREASINHARELTAADAAEVWRDPVLRYSNILDGVFHEKVVVCEADGDCRFYNAVADALRSPEDHQYARDVMFTQAGGKGGIPKLVSALRKLDVPVVGVADFDLLRQAGQLRAIIEALGGDYSRFQTDVLRVRNEIEALGGVGVSRTKDEIRRLLGGVPDDMDEFPRNTINRINKALRTPPGWDRAAKIGFKILARGEAYNAGERLIRGFAKLGLFVVPCGELESFLPDIEREKNEWVYVALERHRDAFDRAPELEDARQFVARLIAKPV